MSAYLELRATGTLGPDGARMLYETVATVIRFDRLPPPAQTGTWSADDVRELAHDFLSDPNTTKRLAALMLRATDDATLGRLLEAAVRNFIRDRARQSDHGAFRRRLRNVLEESPQIQRLDSAAGEAWATGQVNASGPVYSGSAAALDAAAWSIEAPLVRWRSETRRSPATERDALLAVMAAVIDEARAPVTTKTLVEVGLRRFALAATPGVQDLAEDPPATGQLPDDLVADRLVAAEAFEQLSERERDMLAAWDLPVRQLGQRIGLGHSATAVAARRLEALLSELLDQRADPDAVWEELQRLAHAWQEHRTSGSGPSSADR